MVWPNVRACDLSELVVILFQVFGVATLCLTRLCPGSWWGMRARSGFVLALIGLGVAGALCGRHDSEFGLFAGGTMTLLLIGMTIGSGTADAAGPIVQRAGSEPTLSGTPVALP